MRKPARLQKPTRVRKPVRKPTALQKPTVGRAVLYVLTAEDAALMSFPKGPATPYQEGDEVHGHIVRVVENGSPGEFAVNLKVQLDGDRRDAWLTQKQLATKGETAGRWRYAT